MRQASKVVVVAVAVISALAVAPSARAATLKELLEAAQKNNVDFQISAEQRKLAAAQFEQAWSSLGPAVTIGGQYTHNEKQVQFIVNPLAPPVVITPHNTWDGSAQLVLPLVSVSQWFRVMAANVAQDAAEQRMDATRDAIARQVAATYYGYAASLAVRESAKKTLAVTEAQLKLQQVRASAGAATELEVLRAKAEVERSTQLVSDTDTAVANTRRSLKTLTGIDPGDVATIPAENVTPEGSLEELEARSDNLPAVKAAEADADAAGKNATAARLAIAPVIVGTASERFTSQTTTFNPNPNFGSLGVGLQWRLDGPTWFAGDVAAEQHATARLAVERTKLVVRDQVHNDFTRLKAAIEKVSAARAQVEAAQRASTISKQRYDVGAATQLDVIQADRDLFSAEVNQIQAQTELASSHLALRISAGLPLGVE